MKRKKPEIYIHWACITTGPDGRRHAHSCLSRQTARIMARLDKDNGLTSRVRRVRIEVIK